MNKEEEKIFDEELWVLKPNGSTYNQAYKSVSEAIGTFDNKKKIISIDYLVTKYKEYLDYKHYMAKNNASYKEKEINSIYEWIENEEHKNDYPINIPINKKRDSYLYGEIN